MSILFHSRVVPFVKQLQFSVSACLLLILSSLSAQAQVYPVIVNTNLRAPYSLNLSDYAAPGFDRIITNLYMADLTKVNYPVKLRLTIRGEGGVNLTTLPGQEIGPIYLNGGQTTTLTGAEVNGLFNPDRLQFSGISIQQYRQNSALPEGLYQFQFEVIDYNLGVPISNTNAGFATAWLILNDPPLINQPDRDVTIAPLPQQNIFFQWTPRHTGSPNSAFTTVYDLQLVEIYPASRNANDAMLTSPVIFEKTLYSTSYNYSLADPYLFPGKWYAFRVRAHDADGRDFFKNQGYSEVYRFYYGSPCVIPALIRVADIDPTSALVSWDRDVTYNTTELQYKEKSASNWKKITSYSNSEIVDKLTPKTEYVFRLKGSCANNDSPFSTDVAYTTGSIGGKECDLPLKETVTATAVTLSDVNVSWLTETWFKSYVFRYRPLGALTFQEVTTTNPSAIIRLLDLNSIYEYQIRYLCTTGTWVEGAYNTFKVTVPPDVLNGGGTGDCFPPLDIAQEVKEDLTVFISWPREKDAKAYMVYWKEDVAATSWFSAETSSPKITLSDLKPNTNYIYEIKSVCKNAGLSIASRQGKFTTTYVAPVNTPCSAPVLKPVVILAADQVKLSWEVNPAHTGYIVEYRVVGDQFWVASRETNAYKGLTGLDRTKKYEYHVYGFCGLKSSDFSPTVEFTTNGVPLAPFVCGSMQNPLNIMNRNPIASLKVGDKFRAAQFEMEVKALTSAAPYNGEASAKVPYLKNSSFIFGMQNVMVNELGEMYSGRIYMKKTNLSILDPAVSAQIKDILDKVDQGFTTLDGYLTAVNQLQNDLNTYISQAEGGNHVGKVVTGDVAATNTVNVSITNPSQIVGSAAGAGKCNLTITGDNGTKQTLTVEAPSTLKDSKGTIYAISSSCTATKVAETIAWTPVPTGLNTINNKAVVTFSAANDAKFGFSAWNAEYAKNPAEWGKRYELLTGTYRVSSKFMEPASTDVIKATIATTDATIDKSKIIFVTGKGVKFASSQSGNDYQITIVGGPDKDAQEIYALYPTGPGAYLSFGKLLVPAYKHKKRTLVLIPVNGATTDQDKIAVKLNKLYKPYGVEWEVRTDANFVCDYDKNGVEGLDVEGSGAFSTLTPEMAALNKAYIDAPRTVDPTNIYLFVLKKSETSGVTGDMPRAKQFGYLFTDNSSVDEVAATAAHEVGHGLFLLRHVFDGYDMAKGSLSDNLMDYPLGDQLAKLQWDVMHDPGIVLGVFDKDDDAKSLIVQDIAKLIPFLNSDKKSYSFIAPSGKQITVPFDIKQIVFYSNDESTVYKNTKSFFFPDGALRGFTLANGDIYSAKCDETNATMFDGYVKSGASSFYTDNFSVSLNIEDKRKAIVGLLCVNNGDLIFKTRRLNYNGVAIPASSNASGTYVTTLPVDGPNYFQWDQSTSDVQSIDLKYVTTKPYGQAAKDFLAANSTCDSRYPKYIITLANFLDEFGDYSKSCIGLTGNFISMFAINPACTSCVSKPTTMTESAYKAKVDNFIAIVKQFKVFQEKILTVTSAEAMRTLFSQNITCTYGMLTSEQRAHAVKVLSDGSLYSCDGVLLNNCGEEYVIDLFYSTPTEQRKSFLDQLHAKNAMAKLFRFAANGLSVEGVDGDEAASLANMLFNWMEELNYNKFSYDDVFAKNDVLNLYSYTGSPGLTCNSCYFAKSDFSSDSKEICFCLPDKPGDTPCSNTCSDPRNISVPWNSWIIVRPMEDITDLGLRKHQVALIPAIYLHWYICNKRGEYVAKTIRAGFDVITIMTGAGTIINGASKVITAITIAEMVVATADIAIINTDKAVLTSVLGPNFSDDWDYFYTYFGLGVGARYISPFIYNRALALHNKLQTINWPQLNGRISDASKRSLTKMKTSLERVFPALNQGNNVPRLVKDVIVKRVVATIKNYTKYNNVALGKDQSGKLKAFGDEVGANVYTNETDKAFTTIYDLPDSRSFERKMISVFNETIGVNQGKILFDLTGVNIEKAIVGGMIHNPELVLKGWVTEFELQMLLRNKSWYDNVIFHEAGVIKTQEELTSYGIKYLGQ